MRVSPAIVALARQADPEEPLVSVQCQACIRQRRVVVYWLRARDIVAALDTTRPNGRNGTRP